MLSTKSKWPLLAVNSLALLPLILVVAAAAFTLLTPLSALGFLGISGIMTDVATLLFTLMLACTPLTILFGWRWTQPLKKPLALYAFIYSGIHFLIFSSAFNFGVAATLIGSAANAMLLAGTLGLFLMIPLALTSNRWAMKKLGKKWKLLHRLTYLIAVFIVLHLLFLGEGVGLALLYAVLLGVRIPPVRRAIVNWRTGRRKRAMQTVEPATR